MTSSSPNTIGFPHWPQNSCTLQIEIKSKENERKEGRKEGRKRPPDHLLCERNVELNDGDQHTRYTSRFESTQPPIKYQGRIDTNNTNWQKKSPLLNPAISPWGRPGQAGEKGGGGGGVHEHNSLKSGVPYLSGGLLLQTPAQYIIFRERKTKKQKKTKNEEKNRVWLDFEVSHGVSCTVWAWR
jgi:hypothetical protein